MSDTLLLVDRDGRIAEASPGAIAAFGPCVGRKCCDVVAIRDRRGRSPCGEVCAGTLVEAGGATQTVGTLRSAAPARVVCTALGEHALVRVDKAPAAVPAEHLTPRELEVLRLVADGLTTRQIARRLGVAFATARTHVEHIRDKLGARSRTEATARAIALGWLPAV